MLSLLLKKEDKFWEWFRQNEDRLFNFPNDQKVLFKELSNQLTKINANLTFEFSHHLKDGKREFIISAAGIKSAFPAVEKLYSKAPGFDRWIIIKYKPRRDSITNIKYMGKEVLCDDVYFTIFRDKNPKKIGLILFFKDYKDTEKDTWAQIGFLLLDKALGEYDVENKVGAIVFQSMESAHFKHSQPFKSLQEDFDRVFNR